MFYLQIDDSPFVATDSQEELLSLARFICSTFGEREYHSSMMTMRGDNCTGFVLEQHCVPVIKNFIECFGVKVVDINTFSMRFFKKEIEYEYGVKIASFPLFEIGVYDDIH